MYFNNLITPGEAPPVSSNKIYFVFIGSMQNNKSFKANSNE